VCKELIKNSQPFGKNFRKPLGEGFFLTHTVYIVMSDRFFSVHYTESLPCCIDREEVYWSGGWCLESWSDSFHSHHRLTAIRWP